MAAASAKLADRDLRAAFRVLQAFGEDRADSSSFVATALDLLPELVPSDLTTLSLCDLEQGTRRVVGRKGEMLSPADRAAFDRHFREHPLVRFHSSHPGGPTQRVSDCMNVSAFRNSALHADYYCRIGINYVMALPLRIDDANVISVVFNRGRCDFKDRERAVLDALRRPLAAMYRTVMICEEAGVGLRCINRLAADGGWQMMRVTLSGRILDAAPAALGLLARFFPDCASPPSTKLPPALSSWYARRRNWGLERLAAADGHQFSLSRLGAKLTAYFIPDHNDPSAGFLLMKGHRIDVPAGHLMHLPVTERERQVLALVASGKTNVEIAAVLAISARTVQKHLEHIFQKLGVETRTAAAVRALAAADQHDATAA